LSPLESLIGLSSRAMRKIPAIGPYGRSHKCTTHGFVLTEHLRRLVDDYKPPAREVTGTTSSL
jgi:hypothetical protein